LLDDLSESQYEIFECHYEQQQNFDLSLAAFVAKIIKILVVFLAEIAGILAASLIEIVGILAVSLVGIAGIAEIAAAFVAVIAASVVEEHCFERKEEDWQTFLAR